MSRPLYDRLAWAYDRLVPGPAGLTVDRLAELLEPGSLVVDAGCGTGRYTAGLAALVFRVIGIDRSPALLEGFADVDVRPGADVGIAPERLLVVARLG